MANYTPSLMERLDQARGEIAMLRGALGHMEDLHFGEKEVFGLFLILSRAEEALTDFLEQGGEAGKAQHQEEADHA